MQAGRLLFPAIRWDAERGYEAANGEIELALKTGVGGFLVFGGTADAVRGLCDDVRARSAHPLLIGADLERGAGQQFESATQLPPLAALGHFNSEGVTRSAGELTAREARALGINWIFAPVADVNFEPLNPIVGTRSFGSDPERVSQHVSAWIRGCHDGVALACAKHFPGHGRTTADSHEQTPVVDVDAESLERDLQPFRAAIKAKVDSIMTAHVSYPALDTDGTIATLSPRILQGLLRERLEFDGLIATDALVMKGLLSNLPDEPTAAVRAVLAGCDALLYPGDLAAVAQALDRAVPAERIAESIRRIDDAAHRVADTPATHWGSSMDRTWAIETAVSTIELVTGHAHLDPPVEIVTIDDDLGGPFPPPARSDFVRALCDLGIEATEVPQPTRGCLVAIYSDTRAFKGRFDLSEQTVRRAQEALAAGAALVVLFGQPRLAHALECRNLVCAWGGERIMQEAAARWLFTNAVR
jgi:beta-glucosidase-like glycosyl hydrolase